MTSEVVTEEQRQQAYARGELKGREEGSAGRPMASPPRDGKNGEADYYSMGYDWGYKKAVKEKEKESGKATGGGTADGSKLAALQVGDVAVKASRAGNTNVGILIHSNGVPATTGPIEIRITAPEGLLFTPDLHTTYGNMRSVPQAELPTCGLEDGGRVLVVSGRFHIRTNEDDHDGWVLGVNVHPVSGAKKGEFTGQVDFGNGNTYPLTADIY